MQGVVITRIPHVPFRSSKVAKAGGITLLVVLALLMTPLLVIAALGGWLWDLVRSIQPEGPVDPAAWHPLLSRPELTLRYQYVPSVLISGAAEGYAEQEFLVRYQATPAVPFFDGYFTAFRVERSDGLFLQPVHFDASCEQVLAMPLCFFRYQTQEAEEFFDLQAYTIDTKGQPDGFIVTATGEQEEVQIRIVRG